MANSDESTASRIAEIRRTVLLYVYEGDAADDLAYLLGEYDKLLAAHPSPDPDGWIATSERLPEEIGDYLIIGSIPNTTGRFMDAATFVDGAFQTHMDGEITHWWPIPKWPTPPVREQP